MTKKRKSIARDIAELVVAFVIAWVFYQSLAYAMGTSMPIVSVVSQSMYHEDSFDNWWTTHGKFYENINMTKEKFLKYPMPNGFARGDLLVVKNDPPQIGDIVIYYRNGITIVHRVIQITDSGYVTKGDNNLGPDAPVGKNQIGGKVLGGVPVLGYPRYLLYLIGI
jgi:signal peptidase I